MRKLTVAFCDTDEVYRSRFVTYLMEHKAKEMTVCAFSEPELLLEHAKNKEFDVIISGSGCVSVEEELEKTGILVIRLTEEMPGLVAEEIDFPVGEKQKKSSVFKYQPMEKILHEVQVMTGGNRNIGMTGIARRQEIIGIYSPVKHEMQVPFSMILATILSEKRKILYLNFMQFSGIGKTFEACGERDIGDVILRLRKGSMNAETFLKSVYVAGQFSYIPPFRNPEQLGEFSVEDFRALLDFIREETEFEVLVIDVGTGIQSLAEMLEECSNCYCLGKAGYFYEGQMEEFLNYLEKAGKRDLRERMHWIDLPFSAKNLRGGVNILEQLLWSEFGDYVRNYLSGDVYGRE